ncbi:hypothetical protein [Pseudoalteromonas umbrosa]|uniref:hypothetical protein n=1 Tax=Pseudoalteromonas umbrosa TaxID=3048489 RepID=UPI0024C2DF3B|nr:hypothetical protein [Pseudoalteromonas sp. B95]MDK1288489.1 hypothetical protein [Pseudoalteromonas sp. B95]
MLRSDLKIFKPERLGNEPNAGGHRTNNAIESGKLNDVFSAISNVDYASSALDVVKLYPTVATPDDSRLLDSLLFISDQPEDTFVNTFIAEVPALTDDSVLSDIQDMLKTAKYHGTTKTTDTANNNILSVENISSSIAPTVINRIEHLNKSIGNDSVYRTAVLTSYGDMTEVILNVPDFLLGQPYYYGVYQYWVEAWNSWHPVRVFSSQFNINNGTVSTTLNSQKKLLKGQSFTFFYLSSDDFRFHNYPGALTLSVGEKVQPGYCRIKRASTGEILTDDSEGRFISGGYIIATINYETGVITENESISYTGTPEEELRVLVAKQEQVSRVASFNIELSSFDPASFYVRCKTPTGTDISASSNESGAITGNNVTGSISGSGEVNLAFNIDILPGTISYDVHELELVNVPTPHGGIDYSKLPSGEQAIFHVGDLVCIQNRQRTQHASLTEGQVIDERADSDWIDIADANNKSLYSPTNANYSYDKTTGKLTVQSGVSSFTAPFIVTSIQSELRQILSINGNSIKLLTTLNRTYTAGATVSSVLRMGDLQARTSDERTLSAWQNNFADTGASASNSINTSQYPIVMNGQGAINQKWAIVFSSSDYQVYGEFVGLIMTGNTGIDCIPINPLTQSPYFNLSKEAIGSGLGPGEAFLFTTYAASQPTIMIRSISPGHTNIETDSSTIAFRGSI